MPKEPQAAIVMLNDDLTPMQFVVDVLKAVFRHSEITATEAMLEIHKTGGAIVARVPQMECDGKVADVRSRAQAAGHPLICKAASADDEQRFRTMSA